MVRGEKLIGLWMGAMIAAFLVFAFLGGIANAGDVITEIRFRENGLIATPGENSFILIDIRGEEHTIPVAKDEKFMISSSSEYRGPRQYSTEYAGGFVYKKIKIAGEHYHCFYVPEAYPRSLIEAEVNKLVPGGQ
jgi:hypothetical protein